MKNSFYYKVTTVRVSAKASGRLLQPDSSCKRNGTYEGEENISNRTEGYKMKTDFSFPLSYLDSLPRANHYL